MRLYDAGNPIGWLVYDGRAVNRTQYKNLFSAIGTTFGAGDGLQHLTYPTCAVSLSVVDNGKGGTPEGTFG